MLPNLTSQASTTAVKVDTIFVVLIALALFFIIAVFSSITFFSIKYRRGSKADRSNPPTQNLKLEAVWIGVPLLLVLSIFVWSASTYFTIINPPGNTLDVYVVAKQWMWKFEHPEGVSEISDLHVPVGQPVKLTMISQDVIHSFFIPSFRTKQDVLPGRYITLWFQATQPGTYNLFCTQYCGADHALMGGRFIVMQPADYQKWLRSPSSTSDLSMVKNTPRATLADLGAHLFQSAKCDTCHLTNGRGQGPTLTGLYGQQVSLDDGGTVTANESYLRDSILFPDRQVVNGYKSIMPSYKGQLDEDQIVQLIAYMKTLDGTQEAKP